MTHIPPPHGRADTHPVSPATSPDTPPVAGPRFPHPPFVSKPSSRPAVVTNIYDNEKARWGLGDMFTSLGIFFFGSAGLILLIVATSNREDFLQGPWLLVGVVGPHALLLTHLFWVSHRKGISFADDFGFRFQRPDVGLGFGLFIGALIAAGIVAIVVTQIAGEPPTASVVELAQESSGNGLTIWLYLFAILGATFVPVVEELVYRGLFWSALEKRGMQPWTILVVTSAVFAIIHLEPIRTALLFTVGMAIGIGRLVTGRTGASIAAHMFINTAAMTATLIQLA